MPLADHVVLIFQRTVDTPVRGIHRQAPQMARQAVDTAYEVSRKVHFQQLGRKGEVDVTAFEVDGNALYVERALFTRKDRAGQFAQIGRIRTVTARGTGRQQQRNNQKRKQTFEVHR